MARIQGEFLGDIEAEGSHADMNLVFELVKPVEGTRSFSGEVGDMIAVIRKGFTWRDSRGFADNFIPFHDRGGAVHIIEDPFSTHQSNRTVGEVVYTDEIDEGVKVDSLYIRFLLMMD